MQIWARLSLPVLDVTHQPSLTRSDSDCIVLRHMGLDRKGQDSVGQDRVHSSRLAPNRDQALRHDRGVVWAVWGRWWFDAVCVEILGLVRSAIVMISQPLLLNSRPR